MTTATKERPILFNGEMVRAILDGRKTQTRRVVTRPRWAVDDEKFDALSGEDHLEITCRHTGCIAPVRCPFGKPGDRLWVRETWKQVFDTPPVCEYKATDKYSSPLNGKWRPSIHMPRWASRITLEITDVRVERVQDISKQDVIAEGVQERNGASIEGVVNGWHEPFAELWDSINAMRGFGWDANPWVWVITFKRIEP